MTDPLHVAFLCFPDMTELDLTGPAQFLSLVDRVSYVAATRAPVPTDAGFAILPTATFDEVPAADVLCVPGGPGITGAIEDDASMAWVERIGADARWVTSVCTGAMILGAAGLLRGYRATTHWAWHERLSMFGAEPVEARTVVDRNRVTGGGVTAGLDFGLTLIAELHGEEAAKLVQLSFEYDPQPPFDAGSPAGAGPERVERYRRRAAKQAPDRVEKFLRAAARRGFGAAGSQISRGSS